MAPLLRKENRKSPKLFPLVKNREIYHNMRFFHVAYFLFSAPDYFYGGETALESKKCDCNEKSGCFCFGEKGGITGTEAK